MFFVDCFECEDGFEMAFNEECEMYYCIESRDLAIVTPNVMECKDDLSRYECCSLEDSHCADCKNWGCVECEDGYFKLSWDYKCASCDDAYEGYCLECQDWSGCIQCIDGYSRQWIKGFGGYSCIRD